MIKRGRMLLRRCLLENCFWRLLSTNSRTEERMVKAVVLGAPNAGKSTLINTLIGKKVFPVSQKVHTTRQNGVALFNKGPCQVVLMDTPGLIPYQYGRRLKMSKSFLTGAQNSTEEAHLILVVVDVSNKRTRLIADQNVLQILKKYPAIPACLVLNKVDLLWHKHVLLQVVSDVAEGFRANLHHPQYEFKEVFMISGLTGDGVDALKDHLLLSCRTSPWEYKCDDITDQSPETMVEEIIRERVFCHLDKEIPYVIKQSTVIWELNDGKLTILKNLDCKKSSQASIVIGPRGETIQAITSEAREILEPMLNCSIDLTLNVRSVTR